MRTLHVTALVGAAASFFAAASAQEGVPIVEALEGKATPLLLFEVPMETAEATRASMPRTASLQHLEARFSKPESREASLIIHRRVTGGILGVDDPHHIEHGVSELRFLPAKALEDPRR